MSRANGPRTSRRYGVKARHLTDGESRDRDHVFLDMTTKNGGSYAARFAIEDVPFIVLSLLDTVKHHAADTGHTSAAFVEAKKAGLL